MFALRIWVTTGVNLAICLILTNDQSMLKNLPTRYPVTQSKRVYYNNGDEWPQSFTKNLMTVRSHPIVEVGLTNLSSSESETLSRIKPITLIE